MSDEGDKRFEAGATREEMLDHLLGEDREPSASPDPATIVQNSDTAFNPDREKYSGCAEMINGEPRFVEGNTSNTMMQLLSGNRELVELAEGKKYACVPISEGEAVSPAMGGDGRSTEGKTPGG
jgi:hypothetical protein